MIDECGLYQSGDGGVVKKQSEYGYFKDKVSKIW